MRQREVRLALARLQPTGVLRAAVWLVAVAASVVLLVEPMLLWHHLGDAYVYRRAAQTMVHGHDIYATPAGQLPFLYPPFAALFVVFLAVPSVGWAGVLLTTASIVAGTFAVSRVLRLTLTGLPWLLGPPLFVALMFTEPMRVTVRLGQINVLLMALVVADVTGAFRRIPRGLMTGVAIGVKLTPAVFLLDGLLARRFRAVITAGLTFIATALVGAAIQPATALSFWTRTVWDTSRIGHLGRDGNQSLEAVSIRLAGNGSLSHGIWAVSALVVVLAGLRVAARVRRAGNPVLALGVVGVLSTLVSPIAWTHHWVWCVPVFAGLLAHRRVIGRCAWVYAAIWLAVFDIGPNTPLAHEAFHWTPSRVLVGNDYVLAGVLLLVGLAVAQTRAERVGPRPSATTPPDVSSHPDATSKKDTTSQRLNRISTP